MIAAPGPVVTELVLAPIIAAAESTRPPAITLSVPLARYPRFKLPGVFQREPAPLIVATPTAPAITPKVAPSPPRTWPPLLTMRLPGPELPIDRYAGAEVMMFQRELRPSTMMVPGDPLTPMRQSSVSRRPP